jgi:hypothetical protein
VILKKIVEKNVRRVNKIEGNKNNKSTEASIKIKAVHRKKSS